MFHFSCVPGSDESMSMAFHLNDNPPKIRLKIPKIMESIHNFQTMIHMIQINPSQMSLFHIYIQDIFRQTNR